MTPVNFPEANHLGVKPTDLDDSQCKSIPIYVGDIEGGSLDGIKVVVTSWLPTKEELDCLNKGSSLFLTFVGGLPPHYPSVSFKEATHPS